MEANQKFIESIRDTLQLIVLSMDDKVTPKRFLVTEGRAEEIKTQAKDLVRMYSTWESQLEALNIIINGCEGHDVKWDEYCFGNMPFKGVEPILQVYITQYQKALGEIERIK